MIDHQKARRWIHARVDGALSEQDTLQLEQHLQACAECRQYALQIERLDDNLQHAFAGQRLSDQRHPHSLPVVTLPPRAGSLTTDSRAPMNRTNLLNGLFRTAIYIAALAGLAGGLIFLFSSQFRPPTPGAQLPAGTATASPAYPEATQAAAYPYPAGDKNSPYPAGGEAYPRSGSAAAYPGSSAETAYPPAPGEAYPSLQSPTPPGNYPGAGATVTPVFPVSDIIPTLQDLAQKSASWYHQAGWLYSLEKDLQEAGTLPVPSIETWYRAAQKNTECAQMLRLSKEPSQAQAVTQLFLVTPDGLAGDLLALPGTGQPATRLQPGDPDCQITPEQTPAGILALRVAENPAFQGKWPNHVRQARVWSEPREGRRVLMVEVTFEDSSAHLPVVVETRAFDPDTGLLLEMRQRREEQDGKLYSLTATQTSYQVYPELPAEAARQMAQAEDELRGLAHTPDLTTPLPPAQVPEVKPLPNLDQLSYP